MSYPIVFKKCISPVNKLTKSFASGTLSCDVVMKEDTDVFMPTLTIQTNEKLWNYNYIDGSNFTGRQYFITDIRSIGNGRFEVDAKTDVLSTWATQIKSNSAVIRRQEELFNLYLDDPEFHVLNYEKIQTFKFPTNAFNKNLKYVLVVNNNALY